MLENTWRDRLQLIEAEALRVAADALIIEGYPVHEPRFAGIAVYAPQVTTKALQAVRRKTEAAPGNEG